MKYILAVSGGVDSIALLDMAVRGSLAEISDNKDDLIVAHFDHGIRDSSQDDRIFVQKMAERYGLKFIYEQVNLGEGTSEEIARRARYDFLYRLAEENEAKIVTAHHQDDLVETILINLLRGTGWRGLAPFVGRETLRPLLGFTKSDLVAYAIKKDLHWVEDETNYNFKYFRNRVRNFASRISWDDRQSLLKIYDKQVILRKEIEGILNEIVPGELKRSWFISLPDNVAVEVLRYILNGRLTILQTHRLVYFLRQAKSGDICQPGGHLQIRLYRDKINISEL